MDVILTGGFLGSGKTTGILQSCNVLMQQNRRVAVITNDQGSQQVDTSLVRSTNVPGGEIGGGCFCCRFEELTGRIDEIVNDVAPDVIFAEAVGSCTDLVATVAAPLLRQYSSVRVVVVTYVDSLFLVSLLDGTSSFIDESVRYIFRKQMEEAGILIANKADCLTPDQHTLMSDFLLTEFPHTIVIFQNSLDQDEVARGLSVIMGTTAKFRFLEINYDTYAEGESRLAWYDRSLRIESEKGNSIVIAEALMKSIFDAIRGADLTIGHLKFLVQNNTATRKVSFTTASTDGKVKLGMAESREVSVLINARMQTDPATLQEIIERVAREVQKTHLCRILLGEGASFSPGYPKPSHRLTTI